jgi:hypothetical protein
MHIHDVFRFFVACHIVTGSVGLIAFWLPVVAKKGGVLHRNAGKVFTVSMLATASFAVAISLCTLSDPMGTHPQLVGHAQFGDARVVAAIFGWMMLGLAILTANLAWHGWLCVKHKRDRQPVREWRNVVLQVATFITACLSAYQGARTGLWLMLGMSFIGWATVATNVFYLYRPAPKPNEWLKEHIKSLVGAGISVYTAFFAFGAVHTFPAIALHPVLWAIPLTVGLTLIIYHQRKVSLAKAARV